MLFVESADGFQTTQGEDLNGDGALTAAADRFSTSATNHEKIGGDWWKVTTQSTLVDSSVWATQIQKQRLNSGNETQSISIDSANQTATSATLTNRSNQTRVTTITGIAGSVITTECSNQIVKRQLPGALVSEYTFYDTFGRLKGTIDARSATTRYSYYSNTQQVQRVTNHLGESVTFTYHPPGHHAAGRIWTQTDAAGKTTETQYDPYGRASSTAGSATYPVTYAYDGYGDQETLTTFGTQTATTTLVRDGATGLLLEKKYHGQSNGVKYSYRSDGRMASRTWRRGLRTAYGYNSSGDLETITYPDNTPDVVFSNFDRLGRPRTITEGGETTTHTYDALTGEASTIYAADHDILPNLSVVTKPPNSGRPGGYTLKQGSTPLQDLSYGYDTSGRFGGITSGNQQISYDYYPGTGILEETTHTVAGGTPRIETRAVDLAGRLTGITTTVPDGTSRRTAASAGYLINNRGQREKLTREDGTSWNYGYNDRSEVTSGVKKLANGTLAAGLQFGYQYDAIGNREWAKSGGDSSGNNLRTVNYTPNALNQYSSITTPGSFDVLVRSPQSVGVTVNGAGVAVGGQGNYYRAEATATNANGAWADLNITSPVGQNSVAGHRWLPPASFNPLHDDDGNLTDDGRWTNTWDAENRLITQTTTPLAVAAGVPRRKVENTYDWRSRRIRKMVSTSTNGTTWTLSSDERFVYDGWNQIATFSPSGVNLTLKQTCLWGLDLSGTLQGAGGVGGLLAVNTISPQSVCYPAYDGNGNILAWTDSIGVTKQRIDYDPFGNVVTREGASSFVAPAWGFSTKYQDKETGLLYYGYRYYDPVTGKWPSRDPIEERGGVNLYGFVLNSSINYSDTDGRQIYPPSGSGGPGFYPPSPPLPYLPPITSDGLSYLEGADHYFRGSKKELYVPFVKVDPGWGVREYIDPCSYDLGPYIFDNGPIKILDLYTKKNFNTTAGPGNIDIQLNGLLIVSENSAGCKTWRFIGEVSAPPNLFDFDPKPWGVRDPRMGFHLWDTGNSDDVPLPYYHPPL